LGAMYLNNQIIGQHLKFKLACCLQKHLAHELILHHGR